MGVVLVSIKTCRRFQPKKTKVTMSFKELYITNKMEDFSYKSGHAICRLQSIIRRLAYSVTARILLLKTFTTKAQEYEIGLKLRFQTICIGM